MQTSLMRMMVALSVIGTASIVLWLSPSLSPRFVERGSTQVVRVLRPVELRPTPTIVTLEIARQAATLNAPERNVADDLATVSLLLSQYRRHSDGNPVGSNEEIAATLLGHNPQGVAYLPAKGPFLDGQARLIDRWGTPYFFHALAHDRMDIRSAGPDHEFWSADDIVHHPGD